MNKSDYGEYEIKLHKIKKRDKNKMLAVISFKDAEKREIFMEKGFIEIDNNIYHISDLSLLSKSAQATYSSTSSQFPKENVPKEFEFQNEDDVVLGDVDLDSKIDYNNPPENNDKRELENYIRNQKEKVEMREKDDKNNIETDEVDKTFVSGEDSYFINTGFVKGEFDNSVFVGGGGSITLTELSEIVDHCGEVRYVTCLFIVYFSVIFY